MSRGCWEGSHVPEGPVRLPLSLSASFSPCSSHFSHSFPTLSPLFSLSCSASLCLLLSLLLPLAGITRDSCSPGPQPATRAPPGTRTQHNWALHRSASKQLHIPVSATTTIKEIKKIGHNKRQLKQTGSPEDPGPAARYPLTVTVVGSTV